MNATQLLTTQRGKKEQGGFFRAPLCAAVRKSHSVSQLYSQSRVWPMLRFRRNTLRGSLEIHCDVGFVFYTLQLLYASELRRRHMFENSEHIYSTLLIYTATKTRSSMQQYFLKRSRIYLKARFFFQHEVVNRSSQSTIIFWMQMCFNVASSNQGKSNTRKGVGNFSQMVT